MANSRVLPFFYGLLKVCYTLTRYMLACGVGIGLPVQWRNVAIWGNGWAW
nr:hypothetical protein [uncultured Moraxella sp.]